MSSDDTETKIDFRLVQTYAPAMLLLLRGLVLLGLYATLLFGLSPSVALQPGRDGAGFRIDLAILVMCCWVYFDGWSFRNDPLSRAAGFLAPPLLLILTMSSQFYPHTSPCLDIPSVAIYYGVGITWAASSSFYVIAMLMNMHTRVSVYTASMVWGVGCIVLLFMNCHKKGVLEILARTLLYYTLVVVLWFSQTLQPDRERHRFVFSILHTTLHILFVDAYVCAGSVIIWSCVFIYHYNTHQSPKHGDAQYTPHAAKNTTDVSDALMKELQAAKRATGMV